MKYYLLHLICCLQFSRILAQESHSSELYKTLYSIDSILFNVGFNTCDIAVFEDIVDDNLEFYHDQSGIINSKEAFIQNTRDGLCKLNYKPRRELAEGSLEVFPLKNQGIIYGAIQEGTHRFYALYPDQDEVLTSTAKFSHVYLLKNGKWKLARVLSYDHKSPD